MVVDGTSISADEVAQKPDSSRWCWECRRRRLVCDCSRPVCDKCKTTGVVCPGYEDKKPLRWLAPGRVLSRPRKPRNRPTGQPTAVKKLKHAVSSSPDLDSGSCQEVTLRGRARPPLPVPQPRPDICDLAEAAMYYNTAVYPDLAAYQLAPNPFVVPVLELYDIPSSMQHALVGMVFTHRIYRSAGPMGLKLQTASEPIRQAWWTRLHHHRGLAIRLMNEEIAKVDTRATDTLITTVLVFLIGELQQSVAHSSTWRHHVNGLMALFELRGGFEYLARTSAAIKPSLLAFLLVVVTSNTTSPADNQVAVTSFPHVIDLMTDLYGMGIYPPFPCAQYLFLAIGNINHLRAKQANALATGEFDVHVSEAQSLLDHVTAFSPEEWAALQSPKHYDAWLLTARVYHAAVTLYCISSLQSSGLLAATPDLLSRREAERDRLMVLLAEGLAAPMLKRTLLWPLVVAGFEAVNGTDIERTFVAKHLEEQSRDMGTSQPLAAKAVFERFWRRGHGGTWDECFDQPYAFIA